MIENNDYRIIFIRKEGKVVEKQTKKFHNESFYNFNKRYAKFDAKDGAYTYTKGEVTGTGLAEDEAYLHWLNCID